MTHTLLIHCLFSLLSEIKKTTGSLFFSKLFSTGQRGSDPSLAFGRSRDLRADYQNSLLH